MIFYKFYPCKTKKGDKMSHNITFKITFLDYWHLGSGQSGGAKYDSSVIKDRQGFPYVPGKTLKGLLREYAEGEFAKVCFGERGETRGMCYFSNAYIESSTRVELLKHNHQFLLVDSISATKINDKGVAESGSLREIEVVIPLSLYGSIENIPNEFVSLMSATLKKIKRMGLNRTRGLGRCEIDILESAQKGEVK